MVLIVWQDHPAVWQTTGISVEGRGPSYGRPFGFSGFWVGSSLATRRNRHRVAGKAGRRTRVAPRAKFYCVGMDKRRGHHSSGDRTSEGAATPPLILGHAYHGATHE